MVQRLTVLVLAAYLILSLYRLGDVPTPWYDEIVHLNTAWHVATEGHTWCDFYTDKFQHNRMFNSMLLHWLMLGLWVKAFGCSMFAARLFHVVLSTFTLYFLYLLAGRLFNKKIGLYSAVFCAFSFLFFHNSRQIMPQVPAACFSVFSFLLFDIAKEKRRHIFFIATGVCAALAYLSHPVGLGTFFILIALFLLFNIPVRSLFAYLAGFVVMMLPYLVYVTMNFQEYTRQSSIILKEVYFSQPAFMNLLDEIPVRYFSLPPFRALYQSAPPGSDAANAYVYLLSWMFGTLDLRIVACETARSALLVMPVLYLTIKKKILRENSVLVITGMYMLLMGFHPNKFPVYLYILVPYFSICLAVMVGDLFKMENGKAPGVSLKRSFAIVLLALFMLTNVVFIGKELFSGKIGRYDEAIAGIRELVPPGSIVAAPVYFWPGMFRDYRFVSVNEIVYAIEKSLKDSGINSGFSSLGEGEKEELIKGVLAGKNVEYAFITTHTWDGLTEAPGLAKDCGEEIKRYIFYNGTKVLDLLRTFYYPGMPEAGAFEEEVYNQPAGRPGFRNVSEEYQKGLKIYRLR